ncbi:MAG: glutathione S-transferase family protein [Hyphomicrobiales bacterium]|nr:glutathione S-transferase family protein [Hyphomicrobiales bacterium]
MRLYHHSVCPFSRRVRLLCAEKAIEPELAEERPWERRLEFLMLNPAGVLPVLRDGDVLLVGAYAVSEWLEEQHPEPCLLPGDAVQRAEVRRLVAWFDEKFHAEVGMLLSQEKLVRRFMARADGGGSPRVQHLRAGLENLHAHMEYIGALLARRAWLAGEDLSLADFAAAAHLSCADYTGDIAWAHYPQARQWYMRLKSRPSFRGLLQDRIPGLVPAAHYAAPDF